MTERDRDRDPGPGTAAAQLRENKSRKKSTTDASLTQEVSSRDCAGYITSIHKDDDSAHEEHGGNAYTWVSHSYGFALILTSHIISSRYISTYQHMRKQLDLSCLCFSSLLVFVCL